MDKCDKKNLPIAFFDSGVGGLTVYKEVKALLPRENLLYFGDTVNMPYGEKSKDQLIEIARKIFDFFAEIGVKAVVMACNTTSAITYETLKNDYDFKIYPIIQSVANVIATMEMKRVGVFATPATINSHAYSSAINALNSNMRIKEVACPEWVKIVEENRINTEESNSQVREKIYEMRPFNPEKIILGCTHYPYLRKILGKFYSASDLVDPSKYFAEFIKNDLEKSNLLSDIGEGSEKFYVTSNPEKFKVASKLFCELKNLPELVVLPCYEDCKK